MAEAPAGAVDDEARLGAVVGHEIQLGILETLKRIVHDSLQGSHSKALEDPECNHWEVLEDLECSHWEVLVDLGCNY